MATVVTGYVRLNSQHRGHDRYLALGKRLLAIGLPTVAFYDGPPADLAETPIVSVRPASLDSCWMREAARDAAPPIPGDAKDTTDYVTVQHQKSAWMAEVARETQTAIWIDFGILHIPGDVQPAVVRDFFARVEADPPERICLPGIWPLPVGDIDWTRPAWWAAGGVVVMPACQAAWFDATVREHATRHLELTGRATWEVNTWAALIRDHPERFCVYPANHDARLFTGYGSG